MKINNSLVIMTLTILITLALIAGAHSWSLCSTSVGACWQNRCPSNWTPQTSFFCTSSGYVCCKKQGSVVTNPPPTSGPVVTDGGPSITDGSCGKTMFDSYYTNSQHRIVGGRQAKRGEFPWQVQVQKNGRHFCGATVLNDQWILSAAHCFTDRTTSKYKFVVGRHNKGSNSGSDQVFSASNIIRHENYVSGRVKYDIVLIKINGRIKFNNYARKACMPSSGENFEGQTNCWVSGWGALREGGGSPSTLQAVSVPVIKLSTCKQAYGGVYDYNICAGFSRGGKDSCQGDSGGPFVCKKPGQQWKIVGVVSWGSGCARPGKYGVYSSVPFFHSWINSNMAKYG